MENLEDNRSLKKSVECRFVCCTSEIHLFIRWMIANGIGNYIEVSLIVSNVLNIIFLSLSRFSTIIRYASILVVTSLVELRVSIECHKRIFLSKATSSLSMRLKKGFLSRESILQL